MFETEPPQDESGDQCDLPRFQQSEEEDPVGFVAGGLIKPDLPIKAMIQHALNERKRIKELKRYLEDTARG